MERRRLRQGRSSGKSRRARDSSARRLAEELARLHLRWASRVLPRIGEYGYATAARPEEQWQRTEMNRSIDAYLTSLRPSLCAAVEISGDAHAAKPWREYTSFSYPEFDLCEPLTSTRRFDVVICEQVLEHVPAPWTAAANLAELCSEGGTVVASTPFLIKVHELPLYRMRDYWRFTPRGLQTLLEQSGLEVHHVGAWGNRECIVGNFDRWAAYRPGLSLENERGLPVQVWAFARKPAGRA
jgi:SAM-dependent methyltransferase